MKFITSNKHKFEEISKVMEQNSIDISWEKRVYEEIQADSTEEISLDSCKKLQNSMKEDFFIEDTGLYIDSLNGFPGPYSSYVQKTLGNDGVLKLLKNKKRGAFFITVITMSYAGKITQFRGILKGHISESIIGDKGFGYDPIFIPENDTRTLAQMETSKKNEISHRGKAISLMIDFLKKQSYEG